MMPVFSGKSLLMFCLLVMTQAHFGHASIVINGSFEDGTGTDAASWTESANFNAGLGSAASAERDSSMPNSGAFALAFAVTGAAGSGPVATITQQTAAGSVTPGIAYDFSFLSKGPGGPGSVGFYEVSWRNSGGGFLGTATGLQTYSLSGSYVLNSDAGLIAPASADSAFVSIQLVTGAFAGGNGTSFVDDVVLAAVPEPGSAILVTIAVFGFSFRRRRDGICS